MTPKQLRDWRLKQGWTQRQAALWWFGEVGAGDTNVRTWQRWEDKRYDGPPAPVAIRIQNPDRDATYLAAD